MAAPLRVLQVIPALDSGGAERTTVEVAQAIVGAGGLALVASSGGRLEDELAAAGGELIRLPLRSKNPAAILANAARLTHLVRARQITLIHARSRAPAWSALIAARRAGLPFVTTYHGNYAENGPLKRWYNGVMARGDAVIANSEFTRAHILSVHGVDPAKVITVPRGVDLDRFERTGEVMQRARQMRESWRLPDGRLVAIALARLSRWKGQDLLIEAAAMVERDAPGRLACVLAGDAQGRDSHIAALDASIVQLGLSAAIRRIGHVEDAPAALAAADFAVFAPTAPEAFGRGAIEAQAMSLPVIAADRGGFTETIVNGETGVLFPTGDASALAAALVHMIETSQEERNTMGARGRERVRRCFSATALQQATLEIYHRLLHNGGP